MGATKRYLAFLLVICLTSYLTNASHNGQEAASASSGNFPPGQKSVNPGNGPDPSPSYDLLLGPPQFTEAEMSVVMEIEKAQDGEILPPKMQKYIEEYFDEQDRKLLQGVNNAPQPSLFSRKKRQAYGPDNYKLLNQLAGKLSTGGSYGNSHSGGYGYGYNPPSGYVPQTVDYSKSTSKAPLISFVKSYKPGKTYVDKGNVIRNYYRHGDYQVALQHYKLVPSVQVVPYTSYHKIPYKGEIQAKHKYQAYVCKDCYHGKPKIDVYEAKSPYSYSVRRFVYVPKNYGYDNSYGYDKNSYGYDSYKSPSYGYDSYGYGKSGYGDYGYGHGTSGYGNSGYGNYGYGHNDGYGHGNTGYGYGNYGYGHNDGYGHGNTGHGYGNYGYGHNDGYGYGYSGYGHGNTGYGHGNTGYGYGNDGYGHGSYGYGNDGYGHGSSGYGYGHSGYGHGDSGYGYGGPSYGYKQTSYGHDGYGGGHGYSEYGTAGYSDGHSTYGYPHVSYHRVSGHDYK